MVAAIFLAERGTSVLILEHKEAPLKKLLMTGNGECNIAPARDISVENCYVSKNIEKVSEILSETCVDDLICFFAERGMPFRKVRDGYYPRGGGAAAVKKLLMLECERLKGNISIITGVGVRNIEKKDSFIIETKEGDYSSKTLLLATGGCSYKNTGSDGSGFLYLKDGLFHSIAKQLPALTAFTADDNALTAAKGVRTAAAVTLFVDGEPVRKEEGELQITDYGVSGICIFDLSLYYDDKRRCILSIDLLPEYGRDELIKSYKKLTETPYMRGRSFEELFTGLLSPKLSDVIIKRLGDRCDINSFISLAKDYRLNITGTKGFDHAQVTRGGILLSEINTQNMMSKRLKGLFFAGEMTDCAGICGGYNLLYAFTTARIAAMGIEKCLH